MAAVMEARPSVLELVFPIGLAAAGPVATRVTAATAQSMQHLPGQTALEVAAAEAAAATGRLAAAAWVFLVKAPVEMAALPGAPVKAGLVALAALMAITPREERMAEALVKLAPVILVEAHLALFASFGPAQLARSHRQTQAICKGRI
jgi:hypothetical protein